MHKDHRTGRGMYVKPYSKLATRGGKLTVMEGLVSRRQYEDEIDEGSEAIAQTLGEHGASISLRGAISELHPHEAYDIAAGWLKRQGIEPSSVLPDIFAETDTTQQTS